MRIFKSFLITYVLFLSVGCESTKKDSARIVYDDITIISAMKNVMWKGELQGKIQLDTITNKKGLYGIGPESFLTGEILINDGKSYVSRVTSDSTMIVEERFDISAPFFVYGHVVQWKEIELPNDIRSLKDVAFFVNAETVGYKRPLAFKLVGKLKTATIHVQNLPKGTIVSSPVEAHQGQINYQLYNEEVDIVGFFSTEHKGIFTHHDSNVHMHLINETKTMMGHVDALEIDKMKLLLPVK